MSAHTPGPWDYFVGNANGRGLIRVETACDAKPNAGVHVASLVRGKEAEANARLIAAAPELLEALRRFERRASECDTKSCGWLDECDGCFARAVIAKATGGKS